MAPKKPTSSSSVLRRRRASASSIRPAERSASIAICLPGMASRWKRAATSAMRPEPLVMTTKFTITRIVNTMMPITKLPLITKLPNASMTWPAAAVPSCPCARIRRVEARLSASRSMVAISSTVGKAENSSGAWMNSAVIRISTDRMIEIASARSSRIGGSGRISTTRIAITPIASAMSPRRSSAPRSPSPGSANAADPRAALPWCPSSLPPRPSRPVMGMEGLRGGRAAADAHERNRARIQGPPRSLLCEGTRGERKIPLSPARFAQRMVSEPLTRYRSAFLADRCSIWPHRPVSPMTLRPA